MNTLMYMRFMSEFICTALVICLGCLGCIGPDNTLLQISLQNGFVVLIALHCFGFVSGAHTNPCISLASWALNDMTWKITLMYISAQLLGAFVGYFILQQIAPEAAVQEGLCLAIPDSSLNDVQLMFIEFLVTSTVVLGWCAMWDMRSSQILDSVALRMGLLVAACTLAAGPLTGASMNPAKVLVSAIFNDNYDKAHVFITSQVMASFVVPWVWKNVFSPRVFLMFADKDDC